MDSLISGHLGDVSRSRAAALISNGRIRINGEAKKAGYRVKAGDILTGSVTPASSESQIVPERIKLDILYEDTAILVINKKPGMIVHPGPGHDGGTLVNALIAHSPEINAVGDDPVRAGIVHRLDKDTSGVLVAAKTDHALKFLQKEFKQRRAHKQYLALVSGVMAEDSGQVTLPVGRHPVRRKLMAVNHESGKPAVTLWTVMQRFLSATLVDVTLKTGRTHQIRVHFYALGHPLIGDAVYQFRRYRKKQTIAGRQMLHARKLSFRHPFSGKRMQFEADPPADFTAAVRYFENSVTQ